MPKRKTPPNTIEPTDPQLARLMPSTPVMDSLDSLFTGPADVEPTPPTQLVADPVEMAARDTENLMLETGFDGRGVIKIKSSPKTPDLAYRLFLKHLRDDDEHTRLKLALSTVGTEPALRFLRLLLSPRSRKTNIETLAKRCGIGIPQLREIWRTSNIDQGLFALLAEYPKTMADVARDARSTREACRFCGGLGRVTDDFAPPEHEKSGIPATVPCNSCHGRGWVRKPGDKDARQLMGQVLGVVGKSAPLVSVRTTNISVESVLDDIDRLRPVNGQKGIYDGTAEEVTD